MGLYFFLSTINYQLPSAFLFGVFGLIVGSFLNVLVYRQGTGRGISGRSACMSCGAKLGWLDLVPFFSWVFLRARCRHCGSRISAQYPLVEVTTGVLFAIIGGISGFGILYKLLFCLLAAILVAIAVYDIKHTIIPDAWAYVFDALALLTMVSLFAQDGSLPLWLLLVSGPLTAFPLAALWFVSGGRWMGFGDVKLAVGIGWLLGPVYGILTIMLAFIIGAAVSVFVLIPLSHIHHIYRYLGITRLKGRGSGLTMKSEVAFGPFLILSCIIFWFFQLYGVPFPLGFLGL